MKTAYEKARHEEGLQLEAFFQEVRNIRHKMAQIRRNVGEIESKHQEALKQTDFAKVQDLSQELDRLDDDAQLGVQEVKRRMQLMKSDADALVRPILCGVPKGVLGAKAKRQKRAKRSIDRRVGCCILQAAYCKLHIACCILHIACCVLHVVC